MMIDVGIFSAFLGGLLTFFAPCTLPLVPGYIAFICGNEKDVSQLRRRTMASALFFVVGFSLLFIVYGLASGEVGKLFSLYRGPIAKLGGVMVALLGLAALGFFSFPQLSSTLPSRLSRYAKPGSPFGAFFLGVLFALGWSPCLGPILGTILLLAATGGTALSGGFLLGVYALGLALPFLFVAFIYASSFAYISRLRHYLPLVQKIGGVLLVIMGLLLFLGQFGVLNTWVSQVFGTHILDIMLQYT